MCILGPKIFFLQLTYSLLKFHQSTIMHILGPKQCLIWCYFFKSYKSKSIDCPNVHFWAQNVFSASERFWICMSSEHHYAHFRLKKVSVLVLLLQVDSKSTVYRLSKCAFLGPKRCFCK